jgi:hypothetical protein
MMTRSKGVIVDVNIHTNQDTEVSHKVFGSDTGRLFASLRVGREAHIYIDSVDVFDRLLRELVDARTEFVKIANEVAVASST